MKQDKKLKFKRSLILLAILILVLATLVNALENNEKTISLIKGWNMVPYSFTDNIIQQSGSLPDICASSDILVGFIWNPLESKWMGGNQLSSADYSSLNQLAKDGNAFAAHGAYFAYVTTKGSADSPNRCAIKLKFDQNKQPAKRLVRGYNLISISPAMIGLSFKDIFSSCSIERINAWDKYGQKWTLTSQEMRTKVNEFLNQGPLSDSSLGETLVLYVTNNCEMNLSPQQITPPPLPP